jgi:hypothetical protein
MDSGEKEIVSLMEMKQRYTREVVHRVKNKARSASSGHQPYQAISFAV